LPDTGSELFLPDWLKAGQRASLRDNYFPMLNQEIKVEGPTGRNESGLQADRISFLADKYGVSKTCVMMAISLAGGDDGLVEKILSDNRFSR
jgi:hypothetical protein